MFTVPAGLSIRLTRSRQRRRGLHYAIHPALLHRPGLTVAAGTGRRGQRGPVLMLLHRSGLASRVFFRRVLGTGQILAADADSGKRDEQGEQSEPSAEGWRRPCPVTC